MRRTMSFFFFFCSRRAMVVVPVVLLCMWSMVNTADAAFASLSPCGTSTTTQRVGAFSGQSRFLGNGMQFMATTTSCQKKKTSGMVMNLGGAEGIFGVGAPELVVVLIVGYFVLGPTELYSLVKEIGKFVQNIRSLGTDAAKTFEDSMEDQLDMKELREAQKELNDAFSFRRSINVDAEADAFTSSPMFENNAAEEAAAAADVAATTSAAAAATGVAATTTNNKKKRRRRVKKKAPPAVVNESPPLGVKRVNESPSAPPGDIPDLDMSSVFPDFTDKGDSEITMDNGGVERSLREERIARLSESELASEVLAQKSPMEEQSRFSSQLSDDWNDQILGNEDKLSPLATVMDKLAILEEEKMAADRRLTEEFAKRTELEEFYYREKRDVLELATAQIQAQAYAINDDDDDIELTSKQLTNATKTEVS